MQSESASHGTYDSRVVRTLAPIGHGLYSAAFTQLVEEAIQVMLVVAEHPKGAAIRSLMRRMKQGLSRLRRSAPLSMARARALDVLGMARER